MIHEVDNVYDAVRLADSFMRSEEYDWFRGQTQDWPLRSTLCRVASEQMDEVMQKVARFEHWIRCTPGLDSVAADTDMKIAVAQHYGIPTNFIDFTTEPSVAGFFASHGAPSNSLPSCIICLNTRDLAEFWEPLLELRDDPPPEFIRLTVPNLWRLESQRGVFLFCPYYNFEEIYDLDRIVFPYSGPINEPPISQIYPDRKSHLEILLDQYFMNERLLEGSRRLREMSEVMRIHRIPSRPEKCDRELVPNGPPPRLESWDAILLAPWRQTVPEVFFEKVTSVRWELEIDSGVNPSARMAHVTDDVETRLGRDPNARHHLIQWAIRLNGEATRNDEAEEITHALQRLWDGLRLLPYTDRELAEGIGCCAAIAYEWLNSRVAERQNWKGIFKRIFPDTLEVEFGSNDGSYSRAFISAPALLEAVRSDIGEFLNPKYANQVIGNMTGLLQSIWAPDRLFEYTKLCHLFASRIAPVQVWIRTGSAVFYSPARIDSFGLA